MTQRDQREPPTWTRVHVATRTTVAPGEAREGLVVDLASMSGRAALAERAWGRTVFDEPGVTFALFVIATVLGVAGGGGTYVGMTAWLAETPSYTSGIVAFVHHYGPTLAGFTVLGLCLTAMKVFTHMLEGTTSRIAAGLDPHDDTTASGLPGVVVANDGDEVAWQVELLAEPDDLITLRHGWCRAFEVLLDDGRRVRVPAGGARVSGEKRDWRTVRKGDLNELLSAVDPLRDTEEGASKPDPLPHDSARRIIVTGGSRIELHAGLEPGPRADYRGSAEVVLQCEGVPSLRLDPG